MKPTLASQPVRLLTISLTTLVISACGSEPTAPASEPEPEAPVSYTLGSLGPSANTLPIEVMAGADQFTLHAGTLVLDPDGTCTNTFTITPLGGSQETETLTCTYTKPTASQLTYNQAGVTYTGSFYNGTAGIPRLSVVDTLWAFVTTGSPIGWREYARN